MNMPTRVGHVMPSLPHSHSLFSGCGLKQCFLSFLPPSLPRSLACLRSLMEGSRRREGEKWLERGKSPLSPPTPTTLPLLPPFHLSLPLSSLSGAIFLDTTTSKLAPCLYYSSSSHARGHQKQGKSTFLAYGKWIQFCGVQCQHITNAAGP